MIDDDVASYTVERLQEIKRDHEVISTRLTDEEVSRTVISFEGNVSNIGQNGGFSAHIVNASSITAQSTEPSSRLLIQRQITAVENIWQILRNLASELSLVIFVVSIFLPEEMNAYFSGAEGSNLMDSLLEYRDLHQAMRKMTKAGGDDTSKERSFVSQRLWSIYFIIHALYGRTAFLLTNSFKDEKYLDWRTDSGCEQLLRASLPAHAIDPLKGLQISGLRTAIDYLEDQFLVESGMRK